MFFFLNVVIFDSCNLLENEKGYKIGAIIFLEYNKGLLLLLWNNNISCSSELKPLVAEIST